MTFLAAISIPVAAAAREKALETSLRCCFDGGARSAVRRAAARVAVSAVAKTASLPIRAAISGAHPTDSATTTGQPQASASLTTRPHVS